MGLTTIKMEQIELAKKFLKRPDKAFKSVSGKSLGDDFRYMAILLLITAVLSTVVAAIGIEALGTGLTSTSLPFTSTGLGGSTILLILATLLITYIGGIIGYTIYGFWLHLWALILGAKRGYRNTLKTAYHARTSVYLLGWIPIVNMVASIWALYLDWKGLQILQKMPSNRAAIAVVIAVLIPLLITVAGLLAIQ